MTHTGATQPLSTHTSWLLIILFGRGERSANQPHTSHKNIRNEETARGQLMIYTRQLTHTLKTHTIGNLSQHNHFLYTWDHTYRYSYTIVFLWMYIYDFLSIVFSFRTDPIVTFHSQTTTQNGHQCRGQITKPPCGDNFLIQIRN